MDLESSLPANYSARKFTANLGFEPVLACILKSLAARIQLFTISCSQKRYQFFRQPGRFHSTPTAAWILFAIFNMFRWIQRWLRKPKQRQAILYTRQGCHLCEVAAQTLEQAGYDVHKIDIDQNPELRQKFDLEVPVVEIDGRIRFRGCVEPLLLKRLN